MAEINRLHIGCGITTPDNWINLDGSWNARLAKFPSIVKLLSRFRIIPAGLSNIDWNPDIYIHDLRKPFPFTNNQFQAIYGSHVLEHLYFVEAKQLLKECYRILQPGGVLRLVVPDFRALIDEYLGQAIVEDSSESLHKVPSADRLNYRMLYHNDAPVSGSWIYRLYSTMNNFHTHKWLYDVPSLQKHFCDAGFASVEAKQLHQSLINNIEDVELAERVLNGAGIIVEGVKPESGGTKVSEIVAGV